MKKVIIAIIIILLSVVSYVFLVKESAIRKSVLQKEPAKMVEVPKETAPSITINTNDNLDEALQDLEQLERLE
jgi:uncharacterized protein YxeA